MAILVDSGTRVVIQGITGNQGSFHTRQMLAFGTKVVAGVSPGKGGQEVEGVPVFETVEEAVEKRGADASVVFVPAAFAKEAAHEAIEAGVKLLVVITERIPLHDAMEIMAAAERRGVRVVGPNTFGVCSAGQCKIGIVPNGIFRRGHVGVVARSGTLTYEIVSSLSNAGIGQSTCLGLGGDRVVGLSFVEVLQMFEDDGETGAVVLVGEIGGSQEEAAAAFVRGMKKPVVAYLAGKSAPPGKRMGHAGAIIERGRGTFASKVEALTAAGALVADLPWEVPELARRVLGN